MTRLENAIKEVETMKEIACDAVYEESTTTHEYQCGRCPLYSSVHGCRSITCQTNLNTSAGSNRDWSNYNESND